MRVAVVGAGWAGLSAAVHATRAGHQVALLEAAHEAGGRARGLTLRDANGRALRVDNGQHILIGAYRETLALLECIGVDTRQALLRQPLSLGFADGSGLQTPHWHPSLTKLATLAGIVTAPGWSLSDKWSLLRTLHRWQASGFRCAADTSVLQLCGALSPRVMQTLMDPLCVAALNTPAAEASAQVFLRVLQDALFGGPGAADLLLPRTDLDQLLVQPALQWLRQQGADLRLGTRVLGVHWKRGWRVRHQSASHGAEYVCDAVLWATSSTVAARQLPSGGDHVPADTRQAIQTWAEQCNQLQHESIATVYVQAGADARLTQPMLALHCDAQSPAQFVFDRGQLGGTPGLLAFVVSASRVPRETLRVQVLRQAALQLAPMLGATALQHLQTVVEKRATFACTPGLQRPPMEIAPGLLACGDYVAGPYPATLEGAVRSGLAAALALKNTGNQHAHR